MVRGWLTLAFTSLALLVADVVQRLVIAPWVKLRPSRRTNILGGWIKTMAWLTTRPVAFISGSSIPRPQPIVPCRPGVLIVMNHQSLFDIPLVVQTVEPGGYPRIVTRQRYATWIPLISHMVRLYQYPLVDPSAKSDAIQRSLERMSVQAKTSEVPIAVFPEGTRTKDGAIGRFKRGALSVILGTRPWTVYVYVNDGFWRSAKYKDFMKNVKGLRGRIEPVAVFEWTDPSADPEPFIQQIRDAMVARLDAMRLAGGTDDGTQRAAVA